MTGEPRSPKISPRILSFIDALPLENGQRVLEIGCGPGVAAREICRRLRDGYILAIDRSETAIALAIAGSSDEIATGRLEFRHGAVEAFELPSGVMPFDIAFAMRVGALDGRHPAAGERALNQIHRVLKPGGRLFVSIDDMLTEVDLSVR